LQESLSFMILLQKLQKFPCVPFCAHL
jgi:hypothetical protein